MFKTYQYQTYLLTIDLPPEDTNFIAAFDTSIEEEQIISEGGLVEVVDGELIISE